MDKAADDGKAHRIDLRKELCFVLVVLYINNHENHNTNLFLLVLLASRLVYMSRLYFLRFKLQ